MLRHITTLVLLCAASTALAQVEEPASFSAERLRPALDRDGIIDVEWASVAQSGSYDVALWMNYALNPLVLNQENVDGTVQRVGAIVGHRVGASVVASVSLYEWLEIGGELPLVLFQARGGDIPVTTAQFGNLNAIGVGDMRLVPKFRLLRADQVGLDVAVMPAITLPTGFPLQSYMGEGFFSFVPELAVSKEILGFRVGGNLAARFRPETEFFALKVTHELVWRLGAGYRFHETVNMPLELNASLSGATALASPLANLNQNPMEALVGVGYDVIPDLVQVFGGFGFGVLAGFGTPDLRVYAGARFAPRDRDRDDDGILDDDDLCPDDPEDKDGFEDKDGCPDPDNDQDGILDGDDRCPNVKGVVEHQGCLPGDPDGDGIVGKADKCPTEPEDFDNFEDEDGCPDKDNDGDGIPDTEDKCPMEPEDKDDFEDIDGCPEDDNDGDEIKDANDECPNEPEDKDGDKDEDGCPDDARIVVTKKKVFALEKIYFEFGKADIRRDSFGILDEVARVLLENPEVGRIKIEGHTDNKGSDAFNLTLSQARVDSVKRYLIRKGVPKDRLLAEGYGESKPIATNDTADGREKNRRVEFVLIDQAAPQ